MKTNVMVRMSEDEIRLLRRLCGIGVSMNALHGYTFNVRLCEDLKEKFNELLKDYYEKENLVDGLGKQA